jgi:phage tail sheath gpL-like
MTIPSNLRAPILAVEFDSSRAFQGPALLSYKALLVGQRLASGTVSELVPKRVTSPDDVRTYAGQGSELHRMSKRWFANNKLTETWMVALDDDGAGVPAAGTMVFSGAPTAAGILYLYVNGKQLQIGITTSDTATDIGDKVVAAITANGDLPVTAANTAGSVEFTAKNDGEAGNTIDIRINYNDADTLPAGVATDVAVVTMASGAGNPDLQNVIDILGDEWYQVIVSPYTDATNLTTIETELAERFGPIRMIDGLYFTAKDGTLGDLSSFGDGRNSPHVVCAESTDSIISVGEFAAAVAGQAAAEGSTDPALPFQTLQLIGVPPAPVADRFIYTERNALLYDGIATVAVDDAGVTRIDRLITMYQTNVAGADDIAYLDANTLLTLMYLRYDFRNTIRTKYPRAKLADDGNRIAAGQVVMTPKVGRAEAIAKFRQWERQGLVENFEQFKNDLVCTRSITDPNRLEWTLPPDLVNQFRVGGVSIQFLLAQPVA